MSSTEKKLFMKYIKRKDHPGIIYVSKKTGKIYQLLPDGSALDMDNQLEGVNLLLYKFVSESNILKTYHLK